MSITAVFDAPYYTPTVSAADAVATYDVTLNGRGYMLDLQSGFGNRNEFQHKTVPLVRQQADTSQSPSEASINPEDFWRRSQDTWHLGSGQSYLDRADSEPSRYSTSKGVNPWTKWQLSLLNDTTLVLSSSNTNLQLLSAGSYVYLADGTSLSYTENITAASPAWSAFPYTDGTNVDSMATDGSTVWAATSGGVYSAPAGSTIRPATVPYNNLVCTLLRYVKGRLMAAATNKLYNITSSGAAPSALYTHPNASWTWVDFAEGHSVLYAAGYAGDRSIIYKTAVVADGTALSVPTVAGELPDGEIVRSVQGYLGFLLIGTDKGARVATSDSNGNLTLGSLIPTSSPVLCFEPQDRFVWYGLTNYDTTSTGLGRMDLANLTAASTPGYASDLMATTQGTVTSVVTSRGVRVFAVAGVGVYAETVGVPVASGTLDSGQITYALPDPKVAMYFDLHDDGLGSCAVAVSTDNGAYQTLSGTSPFPVGERRGTKFAVRITLTSAGGVSPVVRSYTLRAYPTATTVEQIIAPLRIAERSNLHTTNEGYTNPTVELALIRAYRTNQIPIVWQEGSTGYPVTVQDFEWRPMQLTEDRTAWNGTLIVVMKCLN